MIKIEAMKNRTRGERERIALNIITIIMCCDFEGRHVNHYRATSVLGRVLATIEAGGIDWLVAVCADRPAGEAIVGSRGCRPDVTSCCGMTSLRAAVP